MGSANAVPVTPYRPEIVSDVETEIAVENELWEALRAEQFELYYQPKIRGGVQVYGAEALLRWRHPERGLLLPGQFMEIAEKSGLIVEIGAWVIETACRKLHEWNSPHNPARNRLAICCDFRFAATALLETSRARIANCPLPR